MPKRKSSIVKPKCTKCQRIMSFCYATTICCHCAEEEANGVIVSSNMPLVSSSSKISSSLAIQRPSLFATTEEAIMGDHSFFLSRNDDTDDIEMNVGTNIVLSCENCHREVSQEIILETVKRNDISSFRKKLCILKRKQHPEDTYDLCKECYAMLINSNDDKVTKHRRFSYKWVHCWPAFLWSIFLEPKNNTFLSILWKIIPSSMQQPWIQNFAKISALHRQTVLQTTPSIFQDITSLSASLKIKRERMTLVDLISWSNDMYYCQVKCPWGCSEYVDEVGYIGFHKLLYYIGNTMNIVFPVKETSIQVAGYAKEIQCNGILSDILESKPSYFLLSKKAPISYSIKVDSNLGPMVCTCRKHNGGSKFRYLHPPKNPLTHTKPATVGDPINHAVIAPRTVTTIKTEHKFSTGFRGTDSCDLKEVGTFDQNNELSRQNACLAYHSRPDIRANVHKMVQNKIVTNDYEKALIQGINLLQLPSREAELFQSRRRSTRINLLDALKINYHTCNSHKLNFQPSWPIVLGCCHPCSGSLQGYTPPPIPPLRCFSHKQKDYRLLFSMLSISTSVPSFWECIAETVQFDETLTWHGWFLTYATKVVLTDVIQKKSIGKIKTPYQWKSFQDITWMLHCCSDTKWMISDQEDLSMFKAPEDFIPEFSIDSFLTLCRSIKNCAVTDDFNNIQQHIHRSTTILVVATSTKELSRIDWNLATEEIIVRLCCMFLSYGN
jgi:hypothetical protein